MQTICVILRAGEWVSNMITYISEWSRSFGNVIVRHTMKDCFSSQKKFIAFGSNRNYLNLEFTGIIRCRIHFLIIKRVCISFSYLSFVMNTYTSNTMYRLLLFCVFAHWNISEGKYFKQLNIYTSANYFISITFPTLFAKRTWLPDFELNEEM